MTPSFGNICIAGAGIMGLSVAYALKQTHPQTPVVMADPRGLPPARCASLMAGGMLAPWSEIEHLPAEFFNAALSGIKFWESLKPEKTGFSRNGSLLLAHHEDLHLLDRFSPKLSGLENWALAGAQEIATLEPALAERFERGIFLPQEAFVYPPQIMGSLTKEISFPVADICDFNIQKKNFDWLIDCRGYGAAADLPDLRGVKGEIVVVRNRDFSLNRPVRLMHPRYPIYIVPRPEHEFLIGATLIESADDVITVKSTMELLSAAYSLHPSFGEAEILSVLAGIRPAYPDNLPRITIDGNIIRCNGLFRHGYLLAPVMAQCVADYITGKDNEFMHLFFRPCHSERSEESRGRKERSFANAQDDNKDKGTNNDRHHQRSGKNLHRAA